MSVSNLRAAIVAAKKRLNEGREHLRELHASGASGRQVCQNYVARIDSLIAELFENAWGDPAIDAARLKNRVSLVALGGYGRRDMAPFSDLDVMLLIDPRVQKYVKPLAGRLLRDFGDLGISVGHSVRTPSQAAQMALVDPVICTSLVESRYLVGQRDLYDDYICRFRRTVLRKFHQVFRAVESARLQERSKYGETVYLLEPNIKRSRGGLRDVQLLRWVAYLRYGNAEPATLVESGVLTKYDGERLEAAHEFLLCLRNEMHFHANRAKDVLDRQEQWRVAQVRGFSKTDALLHVEAFMQEYFRRTQTVSHLVDRFVDGIRPGAWVRNVTMFVFSHRLPGDVLVGPTDVRFRRHIVSDACRSLTHVFNLADLANVYNKPLEYHTCEAIRLSVDEISNDVTPEAATKFLMFLDHPTRLADLLRQLHEIGVLEKVIPEFERVRGLLQFNEDHQYTVDEHSLIAIDRVTGRVNDPGPLGQLYRGLRKKWLLHLALLLHDLGKGMDEAHSIVSGRIARETAKRLRLSDEDSEILAFLVDNHLRMSELAFRRDTTDPQLIIKFAMEVGTPDVLRMLFLLTLADTAAVAPGTLNSWKTEVLSDLFCRTMDYLSGDLDTLTTEERLSRQRDEIRRAIGADCDAWFHRQIDQLPTFYLHSSTADHIAEELRRLRVLKPGEIWTEGRAVYDMATVEYTVATHESVSPGMFHKLAGAMASKGLEILSAEINTLDDGLVLDRFEVRDTDFNFPPPPERIAEVCTALEAALKSDGLPPLKRARRYGKSAAAEPLIVLPTQIFTDNTTSSAYTIIDVFAADRPGLLYAIGRTLVELDLSVVLAKIGTYLDQVVDVFYVTDAHGRKIEDSERLRRIRERLLARIEAFEQQPLETWDAESRNGDGSSDDVLPPASKANQA